MTPRQALLRSGLQLGTAASRARISSAYLRRLLRGGAPYHTACRLAAVLGCGVDVFLRPTGGRAPDVGRVGASGLAGRGRSRCKR